MIRKSLIITLILLLLYSLVIEVIPIDWDTSMNLFHSNNIIVEDLLFRDDSAVKSVIVGTSLAKMMVENDLPPDLHNLSLGGNGIYTGLEILYQQKVLPIDRIYIETNLLFRKGKYEFIDILKDPFKIEIKRAVKILRAKYSPLGLISNHPDFIRWRTKTWNVFSNADRIRSIRETDREGSKNADQLVFNKLLQEKLKLYQRVPDDESIREMMRRLRNYLNCFQQRGIEVVFFEMPIHCDLKNTPLYSRQREVLDSLFGDIPGLQYFECSDYETNDGHHLTGKSRNEFSRDFKKALDEFCTNEICNEQQVDFLN